jgi:CP family cyanate transporter-like MFS transporter
LIAKQDHIYFIASKSSKRWFMLTLLWLLYFSFGLISASISPIVGPIIDDLNITYGQMGLVLGAWQLVYIFTASPLGALVDRMGIRRSLSIGGLLILLSLVLRGMAVNFYTLFLGVGLFGAGGPIVSIGAPKVVAVWFDGKERSIAAGIYTTGPIIGTAVALLTAGTLVIPIAGTWRGISWAYGLPVLLIISVWWFFARDVPTLGEDGGIGVGQTRMRSLEVFWRLLGIRNVRIILVMAAISFMLVHGLNGWTPTLLTESGMTLSQSGLWPALTTIVGSAGLLAVAYLARRGYRATIIGLLLILSASSSAAMPFLHGLPLIGALAVSTLARSPMMPILTLILMETHGVGAVHMGSAAGLFFSAAEIGGFGGPFLLGLLHDVTGGLGLGFLLISSLAALLILLVPFIHENDGPENDGPNELVKNSV